MRRGHASRGRTAIVAAVVVALCLAPAIFAAPPTSATIVEGVSMGKVRLLMKKSAVVAAFGTPAWCFNPSSKDDQECDWLAPYRFATCSTGSPRTGRRAC